jgi:hypothetical protein
MIQIISLPNQHTQSSECLIKHQASRRLVLRVLNCISIRKEGQHHE